MIYVIVDRIRLICKENNISIPKLEKEIGLGKGCIYKWKDVSPSVDNLLKVAQYFKVSINYFLENK